MSDLTFIRSCSFWSTLLTPSQRDVWKKLKLLKFVKGYLKLSLFLWFTHWWIIWVKHIGLGLARTSKKYLNFIKMSSNVNFTVTLWFLGNIRIKPYFNILWGEGAIPDGPEMQHASFPWRIPSLQAGLCCLSM